MRQADWVRCEDPQLGDSAIAVVSCRDEGPSAEQVDVFMKGGDMYKSEQSYGTTIAWYRWTYPFPF
jgi:hypothetical protein